MRLGRKERAGRLLGLHTKINKKSPAENLQGPSISFFQRQKEKGEEKPEEELMGKRKSSPRLATTSSVLMLLLYIITKKIVVIHLIGLFCK
ncbi:hypothetical protein CVD28_15930 [Bacillus sp. M6-12]|nr:hypothetical protein CVD28_15930 [Bacillus sp. M6-12]